MAELEIEPNFHVSFYCVISFSFIKWSVQNLCKVTLVSNLERLYTVAEDDEIWL